MNSKADQTPPPRHSQRRRFGALLWRAIRHASVWGLRLVAVGTLCLLLAFAYLHLVGLPAYVTDTFLDRMAQRGYVLQIKRLRLEIDRGLVASDVRMFASAHAAEPFLTAQELTLALDPSALLRHRRAVPILGIVDGKVVAQLGTKRFGAREGTRSLAVDQIHLRFSASEQEIHLRDFHAHMLGIQFRGRGTVYLPPPAADVDLDRPPPPPAEATPLTTVLQGIEEAPDWVLHLVEQINALSFRAPPTAEFVFAVYPAHPQANIASFLLDGPSGGRLKGVEIDRFRLDASWKNQRLHIPDLQLRRGDDQVGLSGWWETDSQMVSAHLVNTLPLNIYLNLLPPTLREPISTVIQDPTFPLRVELQVGPAPLATVIETVSGSIVASQARIQDIPIEHLDISFSRQGPLLRLESGRVQLDSGPGASRLQVREAEFRLDTLRYQARLSGTFNPHVLKPVLTPNFRAIVEWFDIQEPLQGDVQIGGLLGDPAISCYGPVQATNFTIRGVAIDSLEGDLNITNEVMHLTGVTLTRPEGLARGDAHMAFSNQTLRLDVDSRLDPRAVAEMLGPAVADFMAPFQHNGPTHVRVNGLLDYCNFSLNQLQAQVEAQGFGYDRWVADTAQFDLEVIGHRLQFTNVAATAYGGTLSGHGALYPVGRDDHWRYEINGQIVGARLDDLLAATLEQPLGELRGSIEASGRLAGYVGVGTGPLATGTGQVKIRNGLLFETKLFSGLTAILSKIFPATSLFAQTDARGSFAIRNSRIYSRDIELMGSLFSVKASGRYGFDGDLRFRVEVLPLRKGAVATLVRLATLPVTRLLEFRLTGTFEDPRWRPTNLNPADLFD